MRAIYLLLFVLFFFVGSMTTQSTKVCLAKWFSMNTIEANALPYDTQVQSTDSADSCVESCKTTADCIVFDYHPSKKTCRFFKFQTNPLIIDWTPACNLDESKQVYVKIIVPDSSACSEMDVIEFWYSNTTQTLPNGLKVGIKEIERLNHNSRYQVYQA